MVLHAGARGRIGLFLFPWTSGIPRPIDGIVPPRAATLQHTVKHFLGTILHWFPSAFQPTHIHTVGFPCVPHASESRVHNSSKADGRRRRPRAYHHAISRVQPLVFPLGSSVASWTTSDDRFHRFDGMALESPSGLFRTTFLWDWTWIVQSNGSRRTSLPKINHVQGAHEGRPHEARDAHQRRSRRMARGVKRSLSPDGVPDGEEQVRDGRKACIDENKRGNGTEEKRKLQLPRAKHAPCERENVPRCDGNLVLRQTKQILTVFPRR